MQRIYLPRGGNNLPDRRQIQGSHIVASDEQHPKVSELHRKMPKATDKMLAQQLRELEKDGLINRVVYPVVPPKTEYSLTEYGKTLAPILDALCDWGENYLSENIYKPVLHRP